MRRRSAHLNWLYVQYSERVCRVTPPFSSVAGEADEGAEDAVERCAQGGVDGRHVAEGGGYFEASERPAWTDPSTEGQSRETSAATSSTDGDATSCTE